MKFSEKAYANRTAIAGHTVLDAVLLAAYVLEWIKGARTPGYLLLVALFMIVPVAIEWIVYHKNKEARVIRHIMGITYSLFYIFAIFTTTSAFAFVYALPMYMIITLYMDVAYCGAIAVGGFLANAAFVAYHALSVGYRAQEIADIEIRLACMVFMGIYMVSTTIGIKKTHASNLEEIQEQQGKTDTLLQSVLNISEGMVAGVAKATEQMSSVRDSVEHIRNSMNEVSVGSSESAESIQHQLERTEQIQIHITDLKDTAASIRRNVDGTAEKVEEGRRQMDHLSRQVQESMEANRQALDKMEELNEYTAKMNIIIETITSIANNTGMLALNASIEAARAGEAGRGFAVVANQISGLANQTKSATVNITELIENINQELSSVSRAVDVVAESNRANADSTEAVGDNFSKIEQETHNIAEQTKELVSIVEELGEANAQIVESIQTISAITEEVSAHASETYDACEENSKAVEQVTGIVQELSAGAEKLKSSRQRHS